MHSRQAMGLDLEAMHLHTMAHGHIIFENQRECASHDVANRTILDIRILADTDIVNIASNDAVVPYAGMVADFDVSHDLSTLGDIHSRTELWPDPLVLMQHPPVSG